MATTMLQTLLEWTGDGAFNAATAPPPPPAAALSAGARAVLAAGPRAVLGLREPEPDEPDDAAHVRTAFRRYCLNSLRCFAGVAAAPQLATAPAFADVVLAYRLASGELGARASTPQALAALEAAAAGGDASAQAALGRRPGAGGGDVLPTLRPILLTNKRPKAALNVDVTTPTWMLPDAVIHQGIRGSRLLSVLPALPSPAHGSGYHFTVLYAMKVYSVTHSYAHVSLLHRKIASDIMMVPLLPDENTWDAAATTSAIAKYLQRIHDSLAARGAFSPRLMDFLGIDVAAAHITEELAMTQLLDTKHGTKEADALPPDTAWMVVHEPWLFKLRAFVQSGGARRYNPPGPITNGELLGWREGEADEDTGVRTRRLEPLPNLKRIYHYRCVNYNVWAFWCLVHSGGPPISRKAASIYAEPLVGKLQAVLTLQCFARKTIAGVQADVLFLSHLGKTAAGSKEVLFDHCKEAFAREQKAAAESLIAVKRDERFAVLARFTQEHWRAKKALDSNDGELQKRKYEQEVFAAATGEVEASCGGAPLVVGAPLPIVRIGSSEEYSVTLEEDGGLPFTLRKHAACESAYVTAVLPSVPVIRHSVLIEANGYPLQSLSFQDTMRRLRAVRWPVTLRLRRPVTLGEVFPLAEIADVPGDDSVAPSSQSPGLNTPDGSDDVKLQVIKRRLARGVTVRRHYRDVAGRPASYLTRLYMSESHLFWEDEMRSNLALDRNQVSHGCSLYSLGYVAPGKKQSSLLSSKPLKRVSPGHCFTIKTQTDHGGLDFEVSNATPPNDDGELSARITEAYAKQDIGEMRRDLLVWCFQKCWDTAKGSMLFVDDDGNPIKRQHPKLALKELPLDVLDGKVLP